MKQFLSSFSPPLMVSTNSSFNDLLTSKSSLCFKLTILTSNITILFSLLISCLLLAFSAAIKLSLCFEYAALHKIMSYQLIWKLCSFTEWEIMWYLTIFFDTTDSALILTFRIDISFWHPTLKPLSTAGCPWLKVNIILTIWTSSFYFWIPNSWK